MEFPLAATAATIEWLDSCPSTNEALAARARRGAAPDWTTLVTSDQTQGRGRQGREWLSLPGAALAVSVLVPTSGWRLPPSWMPLIAGSALTAALQPRLKTQVKWPNDVLVATGAERGRKLAGLLCELMPGGSVVVGSGVNLFTPTAKLPTERATSLLAAGGEIDGAASLDDSAGQRLADALLRDYLLGLQRLSRLAREDPERLRELIAGDSSTLGKPVNVHLARGETVTGEAVELGAHGELMLRAEDGEIFAVSAGDVEHLR